MSIRNRAEGWKHAKLSGHENEELVEALTVNDNNIQSRILKCANKENVDVLSIDFGGLRETNVKSIFGDTTKSKTDMHIYLADGSRINVSIKKSAGGQVYLIGVNRFIDGFEKQYSKCIPEKVKRAIALFWGTADDVENIAKTYVGKNLNYEIRKHRLVKETLDQYDSSLSDFLLDWFKENISLLLDFCFSRGLAESPEEWADIVWYKNELKENDMDELFNISVLKSKVCSNGIEYGTRTGGSAIQLPFGFVQWHSPTKKIPGDMQFHHNYKKIEAIMCK